MHFIKKKIVVTSNTLQENATIRIFPHQPANFHQLSPKVHNASELLSVFLNKAKYVVTSLACGCRFLMLFHICIDLQDVEHLTTCWDLASALIVHEQHMQGRL